MTNAIVDLVCGPTDPLPGSEQSYRLTGLLGSGGQADVYQAVRISGGVSSTTLTVKVFRLNHNEPREHQYRSWDKGDAVLMDLHSRGVGSICRRIDAFYGPPPHRPGEQAGGEPVPYQVLEYLPGHDLRQLLSQRHGRVDALHVLKSVVEVMHAMHHPPHPAPPVLHMDLKPANVIIGPDGSAKVIDFTGARYYTPAHLTTIAYTRETAGPEAYNGQVGPSYDVHGFGSVAFYMVTGASARTDSPGHEQSVPWSRLRRHPVLESNPRLREILTAPLADDPNDRPRTEDLSRWIADLAQEVRRSRLPDLGVDWNRGAFSGPPGPIDGAAATAVMGAQMPSAPVAEPHVPPRANDMGSTRVMGQQPQHSPQPPSQPAPVAGRVRVPETRPDQQQDGYSAGRAGHDFTRRRIDGDDGPSRGSVDRHESDEPEPPLLGPPGSLTKGMELSVIGGLFALIMWLLWVIDIGLENLQSHVISFVIVLAVAIGLFFLLRVVGGMVWGRMLGAKRRTARLSHLLTGAFLFMVGMSYLSQVDWSFGWLDFDFVTDWFSGWS
jgi:serine/threonine protein kinase